MRLLAGATAAEPDDELLGFADDGVALSGGSDADERTVVKAFLFELEAEVVGALGSRFWKRGARRVGAFDAGPTATFGAAELALR